MVGTDAPAWTFGLNPKQSVHLVPGVGTYDVAGHMMRDSAGTHFARLGSKPTCPQAEIKRLVFGTEGEDGGKPGPGAYEVAEKWPNRFVTHLGATRHPTPRFPESKPPTDAGPGAYINPDFGSRGPTYSMPGRPKKTAVPENPGPGQYIDVPLSRSHEEVKSVEGFGKQKSPRFATEAGAAELSPGPGAYKPSDFRSQISQGFTFGGHLRPAGWSAKIKEITRFACEQDGDGEDDEFSQRRAGRFRAPLQRYATARLKNCRARRPSSAPPSSRLRRACARGRRLDCESGLGLGGHQERNWHGLAGRMNPRQPSPSIADVVKEVGRRKRVKAAAAAAATAAGAARCSSSRGVVMGTSPQRPPEAARTPGPTSYAPPTPDEAARKGKVCSIGGEPRGELFSPPPDTPGPEWYSPEVTQGPTTARKSPLSRRRNVANQTRIIAHSPRQAVHSPSIYSVTSPPRSRAKTTTVTAAAVAGTFGTSDRFPRDLALRPGVGEYDLRAAERAAKGASLVIPVAFGKKPTGLPYDPSLNRYIQADSLSTPSVHAYHPESARGGGGEGGVGGVAEAPPAWSFGGKRSAPRPPDGPGPGRFRPPDDSKTDPCYSSAAAGQRFGAGRENISGCASSVPWVEAEEQAARGDGGGGDAKLYLPKRNRLGARAFMASRRLPRPGRTDARASKI